MLYVYDKAIADDLENSFTDAMGNIQVKVVDVEHIPDLIAQIQEDQIDFPVVVLTRNPETPIDKDRMNFTRAHKGVVSVLDPDTNNLYYEKAVPIKLSYELCILATNTADIDELTKELIFKYMSMYFITFTLPYECKRKVRFGVVVDYDSIDRSSGSFEYIDSGTLYQTKMTLNCEGCVLVSYTPVKLKRSVLEIEPTTPRPGQEP